MLIDWVTVGAQVLNFLILVVLLRRFLYKPVLKALDDRERMVALEISTAAKMKEEATEENRKYRQINEQFLKDRDQMLAETVGRAQEEGRRLLDVAKREAAENRKVLGESLQSEFASISQELARQMREEVFAQLRKALRELASEDLEDRLVEVFLLRLGMLAEEGKRQMLEDLQASAATARLRSAFELPPRCREKIIQAIHQIATKAVAVEFQVCRGLVSGVELTANGREWAWCLSKYVSTLEQSLDGIVASKTTGWEPNNGSTGTSGPVVKDS